MRIMYTVEGAVRSLKFTRNGQYLLAGNDTGTVVLFEVNSGIALDIIQSCQARAIWQIDISQDDTLVALGTEMGTIELYSFKILERIAEQQKR